MKTIELTGPALDWAVAHCEGWANLSRNPHRWANFLIMTDKEGANAQLANLDYSEDWAQGGPIIERELIRLIPPTVQGGDWIARKQNQLLPVGVYSLHEAVGPTPLVAALRCYVVSKLGHTVDVPVELMGS